MDIQQLLTKLNSGKQISGKSLVALRPIADETRKLTSKINNEFLTNEEISEIF